MSAPSATVGYRVCMRIHISLPEQVVREVDELAGKRGRSAFIVKAVQKELDEERRWAAFDRAVGSIPDTGHEWDEDPAAWVHAQRRIDPRQVG